MKFWLICAAASLLAGQTANVTGTVLNAVTGDPIRRVQILLRAKDSRRTSYASETGDNGRFSIGGVFIGGYAVEAQKQGYRSGQPAELTVAQDQRAADLIVRLTPDAVISGRVLDQDGDPVRRVKVEALHFEYLEKQRHLMTVAQTESNDKGEFRVHGLAPGTYCLIALGPSLKTFRQSYPDLNLRNAPPRGSAMTYFPDTTDQSRAVRIQLKAGAHVDGVNIRLQRERLYSVRGKNPGARTGVTLRYSLQLVRTGDGSSTPVQSRGGEFEFAEMAPGSYVLSGVGEDSGGRVYARQPVEIVDADIDGLVIAFVPGSEIRGIVSGPLKRVRITLQPDRTTISEARSVPVDLDGGFVLGDVVPGVYEIEVQRLPGAYLKSIHAADRELANLRFDTAEDKSPVTIRIGADVAQLDGSVQKQDGSPARGARVTLAPLGDRAARPDLYASVVADDHGAFRLNDLAPGEYQVFAWEDVPEGAPQYPEFRKAFEPRAVVLKLAPDGRAQATLIAIPAAETKPWVE